MDHRCLVAIIVAHRHPGIGWSGPLFFACNKVMFSCIEAHMMSIGLTYGPPREKTCLRGVANNTGADQPVHPRSLISARYSLFGKKHILTCYK